jgi:hypothetical protein
MVLIRMCYNNPILCFVASSATLVGNWEVRVDASGRTYYVDHITRTTTWQRPTAYVLTCHLTYHVHREQFV